MKRGSNIALTIFVIFFVLLSFLQTIYILYRAGQSQITSRVTEGIINFTIGPKCGDGLCSIGESCVDDVSACTDNTCYEPSCTDGCSQTTVASGSTDEVCTALAGCSNPPCQCDGAGNCISLGAPVVVPGGAGPAGGGQAVTEKRDFTVEPQILKVSIRPGEPLKKQLTIKNTGDKDLTFIIKNEGLEKFISITEPSFILRAKETKFLDINFISKELGVFTGKILIHGDSILKIVQVIIEVESKRVLFDITLDIPKREVLPDKEITGYITLFNLQEEQAEVYMEYLIKDMSGNLVIKEDETIKVKTEASFIKSLKLPREIKLGDYVFIVQAKYQGSFGTASEVFHVVSLLKAEKPFRFKDYNVVILIIIIIIIVVMSWEYRQHKTLWPLHKKKLEEIYKKFEKKKVAEERVNKIRKQLSTLEKGYKEGVISKEIYEKSKQKAEKLVNGLRTNR